jgi:isopentenyl phosphate kinase
LTSDNLVILKLGGSFLTFKDKPFKARRRAIRSLALFLARRVIGSGVNLVLIHGGGSFGHYEALMDIRKHGHLSYEGYPRIASSMITLNQIVLQELVKAGVPAVSLPPRAFCIYDCESNSHACSYDMVRAVIEKGLIPLLFGDVIVGKGTCNPSIISGDDIAVDIASIYRNTRIVFTMDVEGIYMPTREGGLGSLIKEMDAREAHNLLMELERVGRLRGYDVTGGIIGKLRKSLLCIEKGFCSEVAFVSGEKKDSLYKAIFGFPGEYTVIKNKV